MVSAPQSWSSVLGRLLSGVDLDEVSARWAMGEVLSGAATSAQIAGFITALRAKGETPTEVDALVTVMLAHARLLDFGAERPVCLDVVGTGGDQAHTVNVSTMAALVCAAAGAAVVKHGNRAASSSTGTADVLEELGVAIDLDPAGVVESVHRVGIGFCFAQTHHPAMRYAGPTRRELGVPTVFNILGPLTNPGAADAALIGCADARMAPVMADVLCRRGVRALVVRGDDGLDEISTTTSTTVWDTTTGVVTVETVSAIDVGIEPTAPELLRGGDAARNAALLVAALGASPVSGADAERIEAVRSVVAVNAAAALVAFGAATAAAAGDRIDERPLQARLGEALPTAWSILSEGRALEVLTSWVDVSRALRGSATN